MKLYNTFNTFKNILTFWYAPLKVKRKGRFPSAFWVISKPDMNMNFSEVFCVVQVEDSLDVVFIPVLLWYLDLKAYIQM